MGRLAPVIVLVLAACGRVGFDATGDGGSAAGDAAGFFGAPRCPSDVLLCDSFEGPDVDTSRWMIATSRGALGIDTTHAARGTQSLRVAGSITPQEIQAQLIFTAPDGSLPSTVYLRAYVWATHIPPASNETWAWLFDSPGNDGVQIEAQPDGTLAYDGWGVSDAIKTSATAVPLDTWVCLEWQLSPGAMSMWMNDVPVDGMQDTPWTTPASTQKLAIGIQYQTNPGVQITAWIDEVIADSARIGCAK